MAITYVQKGDVLSGDIVKTESLIGVALGDALSGEECRVQICGVFTVAKPSADVVAQGVPLYFDEAEGVVKLDDETGANALAGYAWRASGSGVTTVELRLLN